MAATVIITRLTGSGPTETDITSINTRANAEDAHDSRTHRVLPDGRRRSRTRRKPRRHAVHHDLRAKKMKQVANLKSAEIHAVVIRADGRREDLGRISFWHRNHFVRFFWWLQGYLR